MEKMKNRKTPFITAKIKTGLNLTTKIKLGLNLTTINTKPI